MQSPRSELLPIFTQAKRHALANRHRLTIALIGDGKWCRETAQQLVADAQHEPLIWLSKQPIDNAHSVPSEKAANFLGQEFTTLIYDGHSGIDANAIAAISGTLKGGGLFVFLLPSLDKLATFDDPQKEALHSWPYKSSDVKGHFLDRLAQTLAMDTQITCIYQDNTANDYPEFLALDNSSHAGDQSAQHANEQQENLIIAIKHVVSGHRRRPLIITAARGRGKSAALGIASAQLIQKQRINHILICAPNPRAVDTLFQHAAELLHLQATGHHIDTPTGKIDFIAPDALCREQPSCDLLIVDEAAAIPVPLLQQMLTHYSRIVFSTTTDGYEGTGRAFAIRFFQILDAHTPDWRHETLTTPMRWAANDPTEAWLYRALLLDAQTADQTTIKSIELTDCKTEYLPQDQMARNDADLRQLMGLFLLAHYQTQPSDLRHLLDSPGIEIFVIRHTQNIIAAVVLELEGAIDEDLSTAIYKNQRRLRGHRLPQTLSVYCGFPEACRLRYARIMRIAVHPALQRKGIASNLIDEVTRHATSDGYDFLGTNYGATVDLLNFWRATGFNTVHLGIKRNASSGAHAATSLIAISKPGSELLEKLKYRFSEQFTASLSEEHQALEADIACALLQDTHIRQDSLSDQDHRDIESFIRGYRGYEVNSHAIGRLAGQTIKLGIVLRSLTNEERTMVIGKVLQRRSWLAIAKLACFTNRQHAIEQLRNAVDKLYQQYLRLN